ncbi:MAG: bifunctional hydroxymethylpyrimidine kinase/phosphomethylpyrimidine kinase [Candidatus Methylacidiphilales bacterium]
MTQKKSQVVRSVPVALTVAGSDNSGGAGIQADLKTFNRLGVYGCTAVTCVVAEHPGRVLSIHPVPPARVREQLDLTFEAFPVAAVKTGMLHSASVVEQLISFWESQPNASRTKPPLVVDPVMVATSGTLLMKPSAVQMIIKSLIPKAACVTPNLDEARVLLGSEVALDTIRDMEAAAKRAFDLWGVPFLIKGGHLQGELAVDVLFDGKKIHRFSGKRCSGVSTHGTGCTFSAAMTAQLAKGMSLVQACRRAKMFVNRAIHSHFQIGTYTPLNHIQR